MAAFLAYRSPSPSPYMDNDADADDERMSASPSPTPSFEHEHEHDPDGEMEMDRSSEYYDSDVEGAPSVYSYASSRDGARFVREVHGRVCNAQNELYALPADDEECDRIGTQHLMLKLALNSNYTAPHLVKRALSRPFPAAPAQPQANPFNFPGLPRQRRSVPQQTQRRALLDCGTGAGQWAKEMAEEWPDVDVVGIDLAPQFRKRAANAPKNCRFEVDDVTLGLPHFKGAFDVVHSRSICNGVPDYPAYIEDLLLTLRPGGILLLVEGDLQLRNWDSSPTDPEQSAMQRVLFAAYSALKGKGSTVDAGKLCARWLGEHVGKPGGVTFVGEDLVWVPVGPWLQGTDERTRRLNYIGELMRRDCKLFVRSLRPTLIDAGYRAEVLDGWIEDADRELEDLTVHMFCTWHYAWAEKAEGELVRTVMDE
ncbi:S-adenosyl-L-methionine-dependent methyltransferase [Calocera viscosa TUFC12733]|uniref:S-adenosyl-L-methionine-dependent methyltransferase n=1 Tax=Calocera viscosa (strain TUFC12733) TaxID=1330018 RepID=A0A167Q340_CALVF|nr:S-adenosyl-L-methionine-dependent methyltransferase [Calocera viscosa TUFC12733]